MKALFLRAATFCLATLSLSPLARADLNTTSVPADAKWILHLDFDAIRENAIGKELIALVEKNVELPKTANIQIDVKKVIASVGSATAYGTKFSKNPKEVDGTLVLQGTDELRKIAEAVVTAFSSSNPDKVTEVKGLPFPAYSIMGEVTVAFPPEPVILVSRLQPQLTKAYDLFRGKGAAAARGPSTLKAMIPKNRPLLVFAASEVPDTEGLFPENQPQTRILKMTKSASIAIGQQDKLTTATLQLAAADDDLADKLHKIVQGLVAMLSLAQSNDQQLNAFLQSAKTERNGRTIVVNLSYPTDGLIQMIHNIEESEKRQHEQNSNNNNRPQPKKPVINGKVIDSWVADKPTTDVGIAPETLFYHVTENVVLKNGSFIILNGQREGGENARYDCIDIIPMGGGAPLHFEAENMKLRGYRVEKTPHASGGKDIVLDSAPTGSARFEFPGVDGVYTLKVRYVDENDGKAKFTLSVEDPEPAASPDEAPATPAPQPPATQVAPPAK